MTGETIGAALEHRVDLYYALEVCNARLVRCQGWAEQEKNRSR